METNPWMFNAGVAVNFFQRAHNKTDYFEQGERYNSTVTFKRSFSPELVAGIGKELSDKLFYQFTIHYSIVKEYNLKATVYQYYDQSFQIELIKI